MNYYIRLAQGSACVGANRRKQKDDNILSLENSMRIMYLPIHYLP